MSRFVTKSNKNYYCGALMVLLGLGAALHGRTYGMGTLSRMGAGFFPVALGILLVFFSNRNTAAPSAPFC